MAEIISYSSFLQFQDADTLVKAAGLYYMQLQRDESEESVIEWNWGKGIRSDLLSADLTLLTATMPIYGKYASLFRGKKYSVLMTEIC